jgi:hypothetical protein
MDNDWICPFCKGTGKISDDIKPPTKLDSPEMIYEKGCTHCLGTGRNDIPEAAQMDDLEDIFND